MVDFSREQTMDEHSATVKFLLEWVWVPMAGAVMWLFKRLLGMEKRHDHDVSAHKAEIAATNLATAVDRANMLALVDRIENIDKRNELAHQAFGAKIDTHHNAVTKRLDNLLTLAKNGKE